MTNIGNIMYSNEGVWVERVSKKGSVQYHVNVPNGITHCVTDSVYDNLSLAMCRADYYVDKKTYPKLAVEYEILVNDHKSYRLPDDWTFARLQLERDEQGFDNTFWPFFNEEDNTITWKRS